MMTCNTVLDHELKGIVIAIVIPFDCHIIAIVIRFGSHITYTTLITSIELAS